LLGAKREVSEEVDRVVADIIAEVRARGDAAVIDYTSRFDKLDLTPETLRVGEAEIDAAVAACSPELLAALETARARIEAYHLPPEAAGCVVQRRARRRERLALERDRGGRPLCARRHGELSVLGADERHPGQGRRRRARRHGGADAARRQINPLVLAAAKLGGVSTKSIASAARRPWRRLAYGTATIAPVAKIVGPGNAYVAAAKRQRVRQVGIDMIAGPSEVLVIADGANPDWIAADLLAQAEHDVIGAVDPDHRRCRPGDEVEGRRAQLKTLPRAEIARRAGRFRRDHSGRVDLTPRLPLVDRIAPSISRS
jgi:histidinol dehydrogenase